ncbi:MAG: FHA domain-containing protein [Gammaproteobacteria bacterium]|nr:FHA domain-containing protein [Gammaproteobacteria bacterium]MBU0770308.1 FHA domain-containing protein [Gammaproteobacteria bacterium]MBU0857250.1 FHA domain-containing protein [Gammaproteobacteria bacterium]MBU1847925.1 FHA domain-containing protein [Gammaproteobacteria bacterium]
MAPPDTDEGLRMLRIGSATDCAIRLDDARVAPHHATLLCSGRELALSSAGERPVRVNGAAMEHGEVRRGDRIDLNGCEFVLDDAALSGRPALSSAVIEETAINLAVDLDIGAQEPPAASVERPGHAASLTIGSSPDNDIVVPLPQVSPRHATLWLHDGLLELEDTGSGAGIFVRGERVTRARVTEGETIGLGSHPLQLGPTVTALFRRIDDDADATRMMASAPLAEAPIRIGRDASAGVNDIVLPAPSVSKRQCELRHDGRHWRVRDLGSTNGTSVNVAGKPISGEVPVSSQDVLYFGSFRFPLSRLDALARDGATASTATATSGLPDDRQEVVIGRDGAADLQVDSPQVSRRHARLLRSGGGWLVEDLGSANGTFVNGQRVTRATALRDTDVLSLGSVAIDFQGGAGRLARAYRGDVMLQAEGITVSVDGGRRTLLHDVSFTVFPTEFVGLMGPSGAGKTTLMMALNGYLQPQSGRSLINGQDLYGNFDAWRGAIGYVPQDDIIHPELTVFEALYFTARLRLPPDTSRAEIEGRIDDVLAQLEISQTRDVAIGSPERKGISGGQRKRVNLAQELITQPRLLFLDEPTSGLASEDTLNVMRLLRNLADQGRSILLTIHQPSLEAYRCMDNIVYLADGQLVYYGPAWPASITWFNPGVDPGAPDYDKLVSEPANALKPLAEDARRGRDMGEHAAAYRASGLHAQYVEQRRGADTTGMLTDSARSANASRGFGLRQWSVLTQRYATIKLRDRMSTLILLVQAPVIAAVIALVFAGELDDAAGRNAYGAFALFLMAVSAVWFGCSNAAREIVSEQAIYRRERMVNLKIPSYVMSKFVVLGALCAVQCALLLAIVGAATALQGNWGGHFALLWACALSGVGMGLLLSALVRSSEAAIGLVPLLLIPQVILSGLIMPLEKLSPPMHWTSSVMMTRWGFEGMLQHEQAAGAYDVVTPAAETPAAAMPGMTPPPMPVARYFGGHAAGRLRSGAVLGGATLALLIAVMGVLRLRRQ